METGMVFLVILIIVAPLLLAALWFWLRTFVSAWVVLFKRVFGRGDKSKSYFDEVENMMFGETRYKKMQREHDEMSERVRSRIDDARRESP